jgi:hypothetical protein
MTVPTAILRRDTVGTRAAIVRAGHTLGAVGREPIRDDRRFDNDTASVNAMKCEGAFGESVGDAI